MEIREFLYFVERVLNNENSGISFIKGGFGFGIADKSDFFLFCRVDSNNENPGFFLRRTHIRGAVKWLAENHWFFYIFFIRKYVRLLTYFLLIFFNLYFQLFHIKKVLNCLLNCFNFLTCQHLFWIIVRTLYADLNLYMSNF